MTTKQSMQRLKLAAATSGAMVSILGEAAISILVEATTSIEVAVVSSFGAVAIDRSDDSLRRVVG